MNRIERVLVKTLLNGLGVKDAAKKARVNYSNIPWLNLVVYDSNIPGIKLSTDSYWPARMVMAYTVAFLR